MVMREKFKTLIRIFQFGAIKVAPGLANILIIPYLHVLMGGGRFGQFSLTLGYILLTVTVIGALVTQPMYRFLSSDRESLLRFHAFGLIAGLAGAACGSVSVFWFGGEPVDAAVGAVFAFAAIIYSVVLVRLQIEEHILTLALLESLRVASLLGIILIGGLMVGEISFRYALIGFALSYVISLAAHGARSFQIEWPGAAWLKLRLGFGMKSAVWLILAGLPIPLAKTLISTHVSPDELGAYAANIDMFYRIFGVFNLAIVIWAFPAMSAAYDAREFANVRRFLYFGGGVYAISGLLFLICCSTFAVLAGQFPAKLEGGMPAFTAILASCFLWQFLSLVHKPLELAQRTGMMIWFMLFAFAVFAMAALALLFSTSIDPVVGVSTAIIFGAICYSTFIITDVRRKAMS